MGKYKDKLLKNLRDKEYKVGDRVSVLRGALQPDKAQDKSSYEVWATITKIIGDNTVTIVVDKGTDGFYAGSNVFTVNIAQIKHLEYYTGANPFDKRVFEINRLTRTYNFTLESIIYHLHLDVDGFRDRTSFKKDILNGRVIHETNFNPYVTLPNGDKFYYQRDYVWGPKDEKKFIDSIYKNISCGKIMIRCRSWKEIEDKANDPSNNEELFFYDVVDGKQRLLCLQKFLNDEFKDSNGYYFSDLSPFAQHQFLDTQLLSYFEMDSSLTDEDVITTFLTINTSGKQMDPHHLKCVQDKTRELFNNKK